MVDEKVWLKAKERAFQHFMRMQQRSEQNELDELASVTVRLYHERTADVGRKEGTRLAELEAEKHTADWSGSCSS